MMLDQHPGGEGLSLDVANCDISRKREGKARSFLLFLLLVWVLDPMLHQQHSGDKKAWHCIAHLHDPSPGWHLDYAKRHEPDAIQATTPCLDL